MTIKSETEQTNLHKGELYFKKLQYDDCWQPPPRHLFSLGSSAVDMVMLNSPAAAGN